MSALAQVIRVFQFGQPGVRLDQQVKLTVAKASPSSEV